MLVDDLYDLTVRELLSDYCLVYSPECDYNYGITKWKDAEKIYDEFDLKDQASFDADSLIPLDYGFFDGESVLSIDDLRCVMDKIGIVKKQSCPICGSEDYHFDYNHMLMLCQDCNHLGEPSD